MDERYDGTSRRRLLEAEALGAGAVLASGTLSTGPAAATEATHQNGRIDTEHLRFTVAVVPDTK